MLIARKNKLQVKESFKPTRIADPNQTLYYQIELHKDNRTEFQNADYACSEIQGKLKAAVLILQHMYKGADPRWLDLVAAMSQKVIEDRLQRGAGEKPQLRTVHEHEANQVYQTRPKLTTRGDEQMVGDECRTID